MTLIRLTFGISTAFTTIRFTVTCRGEEREGGLSTLSCSVLRVWPGLASCQAPKVSLVVLWAQLCTRAPAHPGRDLGLTGNGPGSDVQTGRAPETSGLVREKRTPHPQPKANAPRPRPTWEQGGRLRSLSAVASVPSSGSSGLEHFIVHLDPSVRPANTPSGRPSLASSSLSGLWRACPLPPRRAQGPSGAGPTPGDRSLRTCLRPMRRSPPGRAHLCLVFCEDAARHTVGAVDVERTLTQREASPSPGKAARVPPPLPRHHLCSRSTTSKRGTSFSKGDLAAARASLTSAVVCP